MIDNSATLFGIGMIDSMLEPHLKSFGATVTEVGVVFLVLAGAYLFGALFAGMVSCYQRLNNAIAKYIN